MKRVHGLEVEDVEALGAFGVPRLDVQPWAERGDLAARVERFDRLLEALPSRPACAEELALGRPFSAWPRPAPVVFRRGPDGLWARAP